MKNAKKTSPLRPSLKGEMADFQDFMNFIGFPRSPQDFWDSKSLSFLFRIFLFYFRRCTLYRRIFTLSVRSSGICWFSAKNNVVFTKSLDNFCHKINIRVSDVKKLFYFSLSYLWRTN
jgi:hypothetical protein